MLVDTRSAGWVVALGLYCRQQRAGGKQSTQNANLLVTVQRQATG